MPGMDALLFARAAVPLMPSLSSFSTADDEFAGNGREGPYPSRPAGSIMQNGADLCRLCISRKPETDHVNRGTRESVTPVSLSPLQKILTAGEHENDL
jgi:hypothetical protein